MAKLPFCVAAFDVRWALEEGQFEEARKRAAEHLRKRHHSQEFDELVAELLEGKKPEGKRAKLRAWLDWPSVGYDYAEWKAAGQLPNGDKFTHKAAVHRLAQGCECSQATIKSILGRFKRAK